MKKIDILKNVVIGFLAGIICGLFSTGGGMILVPAFMYILAMTPEKSRGTSVFCILPMVLTSSFFYYENDYINWQAGILCGIGGLVGGYIGAKLLKKIPDIYLKIVFFLFLVYIAYKMIF